MHPNIPIQAFDWVKYHKLLLWKRINQTVYSFVCNSWTCLCFSMLICLPDSLSGYRRGLVWLHTSLAWAAHRRILPFISEGKVEVTKYRRYFQRLITIIWQLKDIVLYLVHHCPSRWPPLSLLYLLFYFTFSCSSNLFLSVSLECRSFHFSLLVFLLWLHWILEGVKKDAVLWKMYGEKK